MSGKQTASKSKKTNRQNRKTKNQPKKPKTTRRSVPAARSFVASSSTSLRQKGTSASLRCREIFPIDGATTGLSLMIPITPTKWQNTRTAMVAGTFQSHRPMRLRVSYEPAVGTANNGSVALGTVFAGGNLPSGDDWNSISMALAASNGGFITTIWQHHYSNIPLGRNLTQNQFPCYEVSADDIPLWIVVASSEPTPRLGYLVIDAEFTLRNPVVASLRPPISGITEFSFEHRAEDDTTQMLVHTSAFSRVVEIGQDYQFAFFRRILNTASSVVAPILGAIVARVLTIAGGYIHFSVDNSIATQVAKGCIIGQAPNF